MIVQCLMYVCGFVLHWSCPCPLWLRMCDVCHLYVTSTMILWVRFFYIEEFLILPCPACLTCQSYISVGIRADIFTDTVMCPVSKISVCIRYDGWAAYFGMSKMNMMRVRFRWFGNRTYVRICVLVHMFDSAIWDVLLVALHFCHICTQLSICLLYLFLVRRMCKAHRVSTGCSGHYKIQPSTRARPSRGNPASGPIDNIGRWVDIHIQELLPWCFTKAKTSTSS